MKNNTIIEKLDQIEWHDLPVDKIEFSAEKSIKLIIKGLIYDEDKKDYDKVNLEFDEIINLNVNAEISSTENQYLEITDFEYLKNEIYHCKLVFLCPFFSIKLSCKKISIGKEK